MPLDGNLLVDNGTSLLDMEISNYTLDTCFPSLDLEIKDDDLASFSSHFEYEDIGFASSSSGVDSISGDSVKLEDEMELIVEDEIQTLSPSDSVVTELAVDIPGPYTLHPASTEMPVQVLSTNVLQGKDNVSMSEAVVQTTNAAKNNSALSKMVIKSGKNYFLLDSPPLTPPNSSPPSSPGDSASESSRPFIPIVPKPPQPVASISTVLDKPISSPEQPKSTGGNSGGNQTIVLTPEQLNALALQGTVQIEVNNKKEPTPSPPLASIFSPPTPQPQSSSVSDNDLKSAYEDRALKRQIRMIKNRESAHKSRIKKREYLTQVEQENEELKRENERLKLENATLKKKLMSLEADDEVQLLGVKRHAYSRSYVPLFDKSGKSNSTLILMGFLFCMLNLAPLSTLLIGSFRGGPSVGDFPRTSSAPLVPSGMDVGIKTGGRSLLWVKDDIAEKNTSASGCPFIYINQSESQRLENELRGWMVRMANVSIENPQSNASFPGVFEDASKKNVKSSKIRNSTRVRKRLRASSTELDVYGNAYKQKLKKGGLDNDIHRRDDTFYVVAFSSDQLLLPATNHNDSTRPKMALVLPANYSLHAPPGKVAMVQIDCEVLNTKVVHVKESALPLHRRMKDEHPPKNMSSPLQPPEVMAGRFPEKKKHEPPKLLDFLKKSS